MPALYDRRSRSALSRGAGQRRWNCRPIAITLELCSSQNQILGAAHRRAAMQRQRRSGIWLTFALAAVLSLAGAAPATRAQDAERAYFGGKTIRLVVGYG